MTPDRLANIRARAERFAAKMADDRRPALEIPAAMSAADVPDLLAEVERLTAELARVGICGDRLPGVMDGLYTMAVAVCDLPAGHAGLCGADNPADGSGVPSRVSWTPSTSATVTVLRTVDRYGGWLTIPLAEPTYVSAGRAHVVRDGDPPTIEPTEGDTAVATMPLFTIKAKDALAPEAVTAYQDLCYQRGLLDQAAQVELALNEIETWQQAHPGEVKLPDHDHVPAREMQPCGDHRTGELCGDQLGQLRCTQPARHDVHLDDVADPGTLWVHGRDEDGWLSLVEAATLHADIAQLQAANDYLTAQLREKESARAAVALERDELANDRERTPGALSLRLRMERVTRERDQAREGIAELAAEVEDLTGRLNGALLKIERWRPELRDKRTDLLDVRGLLSPIGGVYLPAGMDIGERVAPAVEWLIGAYEAVLPVAEEARAWRDRVAGLILGDHEVPLARAVDEWQRTQEESRG